MQEFIKLFRSISQRFSPWELWSDFITMLACSISNAVDKSHYETREALYMKAIKKYEPKEAEMFARLCAETVMALEKNPEQDFLGSIFMELGLGNTRAGQFFTPYHVCELMAKISVGNAVPQIEEHGYCLINEIQDTCQKGRYHNKTFKAEAESRDLHIEYDRAIGYSLTSPTETFTEKLKASGFDMTIRFARVTPAKKASSEREKPRKYICPCCGQEVRSTADLNLICGVCEVPMERAD